MSGVLDAETGAEADETIPDPKGRESWTPQPFPLQTGRFLGATTGAMMAIADPLGRAPVGVAAGAKRLACYGRKPCPRCGSTSRAR